MEYFNDSFCLVFVEIYACTFHLIDCNIFGSPLAVINFVYKTLIVFEQLFMNILNRLHVFKHLINSICIRQMNFFVSAKWKGKELKTLILSWKHRDCIHVRVISSCHGMACPCISVLIHSLNVFIFGLWMTIEYFIYPMQRCCYQCQPNWPYFLLFFVQLFCCLSNLFINLRYGLSKIKLLVCCF